MDTRYELIKMHHRLVVPTTGATNGRMKDTMSMVACQVECPSSVTTLSAQMIVFQIVLAPLGQYMHAVRQCRRPFRIVPYTCTFVQYRRTFGAPD
jgi:hypothetical protein